MTIESTKRRLEKHSKKSESGCIEWQAAKLPNGYGYVQNEFQPPQRRPESAHRVSYRVHVGPIPDGLYVLHKCDNRACINPDHLWLGTKAENSRDMANKRRSTIGERNPKAKLTNEQAREIKRLLKDSTMTHQQIADRFGVVRATISQINRGAIWNRL